MSGLDLNAIQSISRPTTRDALPARAEGDAFLAGGTWLFSEPQRHLRRLVDLTALDWAPILATPDGLSLAATCTFAELDRFAAEASSPASPLFRQCCRALWGSFKIWNTATLGGNLCLALPRAGRHPAPDRFAQRNSKPAARIPRRITERSRAFRQPRHWTAGRHQSCSDSHRSHTPADPARLQPCALGTGPCGSAG
jgi:hypothetical protein